MGLIFILARHSRIKLLILFYFLTYFFSSIPKITGSYWTIGQYHLPFINFELIPIASNIVIISQLILPIFLIFGNRKSRIFSVVFFELFHFYTISIEKIKYSFFWVTLPVVYLLFIEYFERPNIKMFKNNIYVAVIFIIFIFLSLIRLVIPGPDEITFEGSSYALNMYHNGYTMVAEYQNDNMSTSTIREWISSYYNLLDTIKPNCIDERERTLNVTIYSDFNSYQMINEKNYCNLSYNPFWHNEWIGKNIVYKEDLNRLTDTQKFFYSIKKQLEFIYSTIFIFVFIFTIYKLCEKEIENIEEK